MKKPLPADGYKTPSNDYAGVHRILRTPDLTREAYHTSKVVQEAFRVEKYTVGSNAIETSYVS